MEEKINDILERGIVNVIPDKDALRKKLLDDKKLNIYLGIDPTATKIHLGHTVPLRKLQALSELGHHVTFLIGDFTALIGDTSDKNSERPVLTYDEIQKNFQTYKEQAEKILNYDNITVKFNSEWLRPLRFEDIIKLCQNFSVGDFTSRELIKNRLESGQKVGLHETLYPVMQGYDSFHLDTDIQIGAADQTFNMQAGRTLLKKLADKESFVLVTDYLSGTDGAKMSKSIGNAIWLDDNRDEMYGKVMSIHDELIIQYFTLATNTPLQSIEQHKIDLENNKNPIDIKKELAHTIVTELYSKEDADSAQMKWETTFQHGNLPNEINIYSSDKIYIEDILVEHNLVDSKTEAKRLISDGAIEVDEKVISDLKTPLQLNKQGSIVKIGKKKFVKIKPR